MAHHLHHPVALGGRSGRPGQEAGGLQGHQQQSQWSAGGGAPGGGDPEPAGCEFFSRFKKKFFFTQKVVFVKQSSLQSFY
jgi:hypothetical protein